MAAQTVTNRMSRSQIQRLSNLQHELRAAASVDVRTLTTITLTLVYTQATGVITLDEATT